MSESNQERARKILKACNLWPDSARAYANDRLRDMIAQALDDEAERKNSRLALVMADEIDKARAEAFKEAAQEADKINAQLQSGSGPHEVPWTVAADLARAIRARARRRNHDLSTTRRRDLAARL